MTRYYPNPTQTRGRPTSESLTLEEAVQRRITWDVFVSHKSSDAPLAIEVAREIQRCNLSVWLDVAFLHPSEDGPQLAAKIRQVISRSFSLMAIITHSTKDSWWVPFEIGLAFELDRYLASYGHADDLPSFICQWPRVPNQEALADWCRAIKQLERKDGRVKLLLEGLELGDLHRSRYLSEMTRMTNRFP